MNSTTEMSEAVRRNIWDIMDGDLPKPPVAADAIRLPDNRLARSPVVRPPPLLSNHGLTQLKLNLKVDRSAIASVPKREACPVTITDSKAWMLDGSGGQQVLPKLETHVRPNKRHFPRDDKSSPATHGNMFSKLQKKLKLEHLCRELKVEASAKSEADESVTCHSLNANPLDLTKKSNISSCVKHTETASKETSGEMPIDLSVKDLAKPGANCTSSRILCSDESSAVDSTTADEDILAFTYVDCWQRPSSSASSDSVSSIIADSYTRGESLLVKAPTVNAVGIETSVMRTVANSTTDIAVPSKRIEKQFTGFPASNLTQFTVSSILNSVASSQHVLSAESSNTASRNQTDGITGESGQLRRPGHGLFRPYTELKVPNLSQRKHCNVVPTALHAQTASNSLADDDCKTNFLDQHLSGNTGLHEVPRHSQWCVNTAAADSMDSGADILSHDARVLQCGNQTSTGSDFCSSSSIRQLPVAVHNTAVPVECTPNCKSPSAMLPSVDNALRTCGIAVNDAFKEDTCSGRLDCTQGDLNSPSAVLSIPSATNAQQLQLSFACSDSAISSCGLGMTAAPAASSHAANDRSKNAAFQIQKFSDGFLNLLKESSHTVSAFDCALWNTKRSKYEDFITSVPYYAVVQQCTGTSQDGASASSSCNAPAGLLPKQRLVSATHKSSPQYRAAAGAHGDIKSGKLHGRTGKLQATPLSPPQNDCGRVSEGLVDTSDIASFKSKRSPKRNVASKGVAKAYGVHVHSDTTMVNDAGTEVSVSSGFRTCRNQKSITDELEAIFKSVLESNGEDGQSNSSDVKREKECVNSNTSKHIRVSSSSAKRLNGSSNLPTKTTGRQRQTKDAVICNSPSVIGSTVKNISSITKDGEKPSGSVDSVSDDAKGLSLQRSRSSDVKGLPVVSDEAKASFLSSDTTANVKRHERKEHKGQLTVKSEAVAVCELSSDSASETTIECEDVKRAVSLHCSMLEQPVTDEGIEADQVANNTDDGSDNKFKKKANGKKLIREIANSEGFVADKLTKKSNTVDLFVEPSQLTREERAIQMALMRITQMEVKKALRFERHHSTEPDRKKDISETSKLKVKLKSEVKDGVNKVWRRDALKQERESGMKKSSVSKIGKRWNQRKPDVQFGSNRTPVKIQKKSGTVWARQCIKAQLKRQKKKFQESVRQTACSQKESQKSMPAKKDTVLLVNASSPMVKPVLSQLTVSTADDPVKLPGSTSVSPSRSFAGQPSSHDSSFSKFNIPDYVKKLMTYHATGETVLHRAARLGYEDVVRWCCQSGFISVNVRDNAGYCPLHESCVGGHVNIAKCLIQYGADVNAASRLDGARPLHDAVETDNIEMVRLLLASGADINLVTYSEKTVFALAQSLEMKDFLRVVRFNRPQSSTTYVVGRHSKFAMVSLLRLLAAVPVGSCVCCVAFLADINGAAAFDIECSWKFQPPWTDTNEDNGYGVFDDAPDDDVNNACHQMTLECSTQPFLPIFFLQLHGQRQPDNFLLLRDVLNHVGLTRDEFVASHGNEIVVHEISQKDLQQSPASGGPQKETDDANSAAAETTHMDSQHIELVRMCDNVRRLLGIEIIPANIQTT